MFIASKNNILIPGGKDRDDVRISRGFVGEVPDWVGGTAYFKALVQCGKIRLSEDSKAKKRSKSSSKPKKPSRDETPLEKPGETPGESGGAAG